MLEQLHDIEGGLTVRTVTVTPEIAIRWLNNYKYEGQRDVRQWKVDELVEALQNNTFTRGSQIHIAVFNKVKFLINGQHRLWAISESGMSMLFTVLETQCSSMDEVAELYYREDTVLTRGVKEVLKAAGLPKKHNVPAEYLRHVSAGLRFMEEGFSMSKSKHAMSNDKLRDLTESWIVEAKAYHETLMRSNRLIRSKLLRAPVMGVALVLYRYAPDSAKEFFAAVAADDGLNQGDPRKTLHDFLLLAQQEATIKKKRVVSSAYISRVIARCWNAYLNGKRIVYLNIPAEAVLAPIVLKKTPYKGE